MSLAAPLIGGKDKQFLNFAYRKREKVSIFAAKTSYFYEETDFNTIRFITQSHNMEISRENVRQWLFQYISFCSWGVTNAIRIMLPPSDDMNNSIKLLLKGPFSENQLNNLLERLMNALTDGVLEEIITLDMFKKLFEIYDISTIENVREFLLSNENNDNNK